MHPDEILCRRNVVNFQLGRQRLDVGQRGGLFAFELVEAGFLRRFGNRDYIVSWLSHD